MARAQEAGVAGTAGSGHPLHDRLTRRCDVVIANGAECEPLLANDRTVMTRYPEQVLQGLALALEAVDASRGVIAARGNDTEVMRTLGQARRRNPGVSLNVLEDVYPAGEAYGLVREVTGRQVPPGGHPEDVGVMVVNVQTLWMLAEAARGRPVTHRFVTVLGEVAQPRVMRVPLGTTVGELVTLCGGATIDAPGYVAGGPMRGKVVDAGAPITRTTSAVLVLPEAHPLVTRRTLPLDALLKRAASACGGCRLCTDRCPRHLQGYAIEPHLLMRGLANRLDTVPEVVTGAGSCSSCRLCEAVCPAGLSPGRLYGAVASDLMARGLRELPRNPARAIHEALNDRRAPRSWLVDRLGLRRFAGELSVDDNYHAVKRVVLPLGNTDAVAAEGQKVRLGDLVAEPRGLGSRVFSPIDGRVERIASGRLEIVRG